MKQYIDLIERIIKEGVEKSDRTGTGTISIFGHQSTYDMSEGFPLLTAKSTYQKGFIIELLWFLGIHMKDERYNKLPMTNIKYLVDNNVNIWNEWPHRDMLKYQEEMHQKMSAEFPNQNFNPPAQLTLKEFAVKIKEEDGFAEKWGNLGSVYGKQWRKWAFTDYVKTDSGMQAKIGFVDQLQVAINKLKMNPEDRGNIISAWNVGELDQMALRPCHTMFQFYSQPMSVEERNKWFLVNWCGGNVKDCKTDWKDFELDQQGVPKYKLSLQLYQRSADVFLGVPFNVASYSLLLHMVAQVVNMVPDKFVHTFGDAHIYSNHKSQVNELLNRIYDFENDISEDFWANKFLCGNFKRRWPALPNLKLNSEVKDIMDFRYEDIKIENYNPLPKIEAPVAI